jgi:cbb3-type cytochrome oxidase maturation protein
MDIIYLLLPFSLLLAGCAFYGFLWASKSGQLDDLETPAQRMLYDDDTDVDDEQHS